MGPTNWRKDPSSLGCRTQHLCHLVGVIHGVDGKALNPPSNPEESENVTSWRPSQEHGQKHNRTNEQVDAWFDCRSFVSGCSIPDIPDISDIPEIPRRNLWKDLGGFGESAPSRMANCLLCR